MHACIQVRIAAENGISPLVAALRSADPKIHEHVLVTLRNISSNQDNKVMLLYACTLASVYVLLALFDVSQRNDNISWNYRTCCHAYLDTIVL